MKKNDGASDRPLKPDTKITVAGRDPFAQHGYVNPPVYHASTLLYPTAEDFLGCRAGRYHNMGAVERPIRSAGVRPARDRRTRMRRRRTRTLGPCGNFGRALLGAAGRRPPARFRQRLRPDTDILRHRIGARYGVTMPLRPARRRSHRFSNATETARCFLPKHRVRSPSRCEDIPAIAAAAHAQGAIVLMDNTWASPLFFSALDHGVDLSIQSGTKYIGGHSDLMLGSVAANATTWQRLHDTAGTMGTCVGPDDMFLGLRGLRTMAVRLARHQTSGIAVARWFEGRPEVLRVLHPALASDPGHAIWRRDFTGASGLFLRRSSRSAGRRECVPQCAYAVRHGCIVADMSLAIRSTAKSTATKWVPGGPTIRFHIDPRTSTI